MKKILIGSIVLLFFFTSFNCKKDVKKVIPREGLVNFITGNVKAIGADGKELDLKVGDSVKEGMKIKTTGKKSIVDVYFGENAIKILGDTVVDIKKLILDVNKNSEQSELFVEKGQVFSKIKKLSKEDDYKVKTPTSTAGVRGTDFLVTQEDGKANIACLDGKVEVLNPTKADAKPVMLDGKEEVDVLSGQDMVKKQLSADRLRALNILLEIKAMREEIWEKMRKQREEIKQYVIDQKEKDKTLVDKQKEGDKALVEDQKARDRAMLDKNKAAIKDETTGKMKESVSDAKSKMDAVKDVDKDASKKAALEKAGDMKPKIDKMKIDKDSMKPKM